MNKQAFNIVCTLMNLAVIYPAYSYPAYSKAPAYEITCGTVKESDGIFSIVKAGTDIPYVTRQTDPSFNFGCIIHAEENGFTMHSIISAPKPKSEILTSNRDLSKTIESDILIVKNAPETFEKTAYVVIRLDEGDSTGEYLIDIYINGALTKNVVFNVGNKSYNKELQQTPKNGAAEP